jgi:hypothetical protein
MRIARASIALLLLAACSYTKGPCVREEHITIKTHCEREGEARTLRIPRQGERD